MNKKFYIILALAILFIIYCFCEGYFVSGHSDIDNLYVHFSGKVDSVTYNIKGEPTIVVKGTHYELNCLNWDFDHNRIEKGDSIIKKQHSMIIKLIKRNKTVIIQGEDN